MRICSATEEMRGFNIINNTKVAQLVNSNHFLISIYLKYPSHHQNIPIYKQGRKDIPVPSDSSLQPISSGVINPPRHLEAFRNPTASLSSPIRDPPPFNCPPLLNPSGFLFIFSPPPIAPGAQCCRGPPEMRRVRSPPAVGPWPLLPTRLSSTMSPRPPA